MGWRSPVNGQLYTNLISSMECRSWVRGTSAAVLSSKKVRHSSNHYWMGPQYIHMVSSHGQFTKAISEILGREIKLVPYKKRFSWLRSSRVAILHVTRCLDLDLGVFNRRAAEEVGCADCILSGQDVCGDKITNLLRAAEEVGCADCSPVSFVWTGCLWWQNHYK